MTPPSDPIVLALEQSLGDRYRVEGPLGAGGMAVVYRARDLRHDRDVAIKVLRPELASSLGPDRFLREIRIAAGLQHPHIIGLIDSGQTGDTIYYVMPLVEGESLRDRLDRAGPVPVHQTVRLLREVADALAKAHRSGILHRDIKPDNILLADGHAFVADFGVARAVGDATTPTNQTGVGIAVGTPAYMAPEQVAADPNLDHRADIYSLGIVAYEMLTGRLPLQADSPHLMLAAHVTTPPRPLSELRSDLPAVLVEAVMRCLEKDPARRFDTAEDLMARLELLSTGTGEVGALPPRAPRRGARIALGAATIAVLGLVLWRVIPARGPETAGGEFASLAVMPLVNLTRDSSDEYFSDGMTEEILSAVSRIPGVRVAARTSSFTFKGKTLPAPTIARELRVRHLLEGSVERSGNRVRVRARLVDGPRDTEVWSDSFDHDAGDLFALQDSVAGAIARELTTRVGSGAARAASATTASPEAYDAYLRGLQLLRRRSGPADLRQAVAHFQTAVERDSGFARAWAGLGSAWVLQPDYGAAPPEAAHPAARGAIQRALALDSTNSEALAALGYLYRSFEWNWPDAEAVLRRSLASDPNAATSWQWLGETLDIVGRYPDAQIAHDSAVALDQLSPIVRVARGAHFLAAGDDAAARADLLRALELAPGLWPASGQLILLDLAEGRADSARAVLERERPGWPFDPEFTRRLIAASGSPDSIAAVLPRLEQWRTEATVPPLMLASFLAVLGQKDRALDVLEEGVKQQDPLLVHLRWWRAFKTLRKEPRYTALLVRLGLPPLQ